MNKQPAHITMGLRIIGGLIVLTGVFLGGVYIGYQNRPATQKITGVVHKESPLVSSSSDFSPFWSAWQILNEKFPGADKISDDTRMYGAIKGLASSFGDPYTTFFPPSENTIFQTAIAGSFVGIGVEIGEKDGILTIIAPLKGTPAERAGIKAGDKIIKIADKTTADMKIDTAISMIRGQENTIVSLTIVREGSNEQKVFEVKRERIELPTVDVEKREKEGVFVIRLYSFSAQSAELFRGVLDQYLASGYHNLLLDLRDNPGGYIDAANAIGSWFIPEGQTIVKEIGKTPDDITLHTSKGPVLFPKKDKLIILANKGSASASEILAGALSEYGIGTLVGEQTFGKGSVQQVIQLTPDTSLKVTIAKWYTPHGVSISESGLSPKIVIKQPSDAKTDVVLDKAVALFANGIK